MRNIFRCGNTLYDKKPQGYEACLKRKEWLRSIFIIQCLNTDNPPLPPPYLLPLKHTIYHHVHYLVVDI